MTASRRLLLSLVALLLALAAPVGTAADEAGITLPRASVRTPGEVYLLDAVARIEFSPPVRQALNSGVPLTFEWQIEIGRARDWWFEAAVAALSQRFTVEYHALSAQYIVTNRNTGKRRSFARLRIALDFIGTLIGYPLIDRVLIETPSRHVGYVRLHLVHDELPLPLRPEALLSSSWDLTSEWRQWSFE